MLIFAVILLHNALLATCQISINVGDFSEDDLQKEDRRLLDTIPGEPHSDYPTYASIPRTGFSCKGRPNWGYYADVEAGCQVFHVCETEHSKFSFLCPIGNVFNQHLLVCDWWYNFNCADAENYEIPDVNNELQEIDNGGNHYDLNIASSGGNSNNDVSNKNEGGNQRSNQYNKSNRNRK